MREYGSVHTCFWSDSEIQQLSDRAKLIALYLLTGPHTNMLGCFRLPIGYIAEDLKWGSETVTKGLHELFQIGFLMADQSSGWLVIHNFLKWNPIANPNQGKSIQKLFEFVPEKSCIYSATVDVLLFYGKHLEEPFINRLQTISKQFRNQEQEQDQEQEQEKEQEKEQDQDQNICGELKNSSTPQVGVVKDDLPVVILIPLNDKTEFPITQLQINEWQELYPAVDITQELKKIRGWNLSNPKNRKTKSGILRHITQWLAKTQDRTSPQQNSTRENHHAKNQRFSRRSESILRVIESCAPGINWRSDEGTETHVTRCNHQ